MNIALIVDEPTRDLNGLILLGLELVRRGHYIALVTESRINELKWICPDVIVFNYLLKKNEEIIRYWQNQGAKTYLLNSEGANLTFDYVASLTQSLKQIDLDVRFNMFVCSWNKKYAEFVISSNLFNNYNVVVTGSPRFDYYRKQFIDYRLNYSQHVIEKYKKPILLIAGGFALSNPKYLTPQEEVYMNIASGLAMSLSELFRYQEYDFSILHSFIELAKKIAVTFPNITVIYRPHPFENSSLYADKFANISNLFLETSGSITEYLAHSCCLLHWQSTTAFEARMLGIPVLRPQWLEKKEYSISERPVAKLSDNVISEDTLLNSVEEILNGKYHYLSEGNISEEILFDDSLASKKVADFIEFHPTSSLENMKDKHRIDLYNIDQTSSSVSYGQVMNRLRKKLNLPTNLTRFGIRKKGLKISPKRFSKHDVEVTITALKKVDGFRNLKVRVISQNPYAYTIPLIGGKTVFLKKG